MRSIIDNYLYDVVKHLDYPKREKVKKELNSLILDKLEERTSGREALETDVYAVLEELGSPYHVAEKYMGDEKNTLLSGIYFRYYKRILLLVLPLVVIISVTDSYITNAFSQEDWMSNLKACTESAIYAFCFYFCVITAIFVLLQRYNVKFNSYNIGTLQKTSDEARKNINIKSICILIISFVIGIITYIKPSLIFYAVSHGKRISILNEDLFLQLRFVIIGMLVVVLIRECSVIVNRYMNVKLYIWVTILDVVNLILFCVLFLRHNIINPNFLNIFKEMFVDEPIIIEFFSNIINYWIVILFSVLVLSVNLGDFFRIKK
ncbi:hypothetical protein BG262_08205 [Floricoccus penangensis]|uniref:Uncharacterized protein n=1 Tax=Floricoccus penangensis TaxID=1859475 RepID=A0A9Q5JI92_9LACT|nr:hypothetical protein [Floricoccus penangensis]OFI47677.1 hypothetical protein BG262_08205 [Floricoccus penangensis]